jgi:hypothetical protein
LKEVTAVTKAKALVFVTSLSAFLATLLAGFQDGR